MKRVNLMQLWVCIALFAGVGFGFGVARLTMSPAPTARPLVVNTGARLDEAALRAMIRDVLREELRNARADEDALAMRQ
jgi:hypothetical protein